MDVRVKFIISLAALVVIVVTLGVFIYFSAASREGTTAVDETADLLPFDPTPIEPDSEAVGFDTFLSNTPAPVESDPADDPSILATVTISDTIPPSEQLRFENEEVSADPNEALYTVYMHASWSKQLHQEWYAPGAHLSPMVAWAHTLENVVFKSGDIASDGMETMAESGGTKPIERELRDLRNRGSIFSYSFGSRIDAPGEDSVTLSISRNTPRASVVSMIAPSPDWFIGAHNVLLFENEQWRDRVSVPAVLYDAGTDSGTTFTAYNRNTNPQEPIFRIPDAPPLPIAVFEFVRN